MDAWIVGHTRDKVRILDKTPSATVTLYDYSKDEVYNALKNNEITINNIYTLSLFYRQCNVSPDLDLESYEDKFIVAEIIMNNVFSYKFRVMTPNGEDKLVDAEVFLKDKNLIRNALNIRIYKNSDLGSTLALKNGDYYYISNISNKKEFKITYSKEYKDRNKRFLAKMGIIKDSLDNNTLIKDIYNNISSDVHAKDNSEFMYSIYKDMESVNIPHLDIDFSKLTTKYLPTDIKLSLQAELQAYKNKSPRAFGNMFVILWGILKNFPNCIDEAMEEIDLYNEDNDDRICEMYEHTYVIYDDTLRKLKIAVYDTSCCGESGFICITYKKCILYAVKQEAINSENSLIEEIEDLESKEYTFDIAITNYKDKSINITNLINKHKAYFGYIDIDTNNKTKFILDGIEIQWELAKNLRRLIIDRRIEVAVERVTQDKFSSKPHNKHYYLDLMDGTLIVLTSNVNDKTDDYMVISKINNLYQFSEWSTNKEIIRLIGKRLGLK